MPPGSTLTSPLSRENQSSVLFIFLGASNLARSLYGLKRCITRCVFPRPVSFLHAMGPGRGYISQGGIFNAIYPPILYCDILKAAYNKRKKNQQVIVLITDIGNDIMYGVSSEEIIEGLNLLFNRLNELEAKVFITSIPIDLKKDVSAFYFRILRCIFFPKSYVEQNQASEAIQTINDFIFQAFDKNITVINEMKKYCGIDKIHYSLFKSRAAWSHIASNLTNPLAIKVAPELKVSELILSLANNLGQILFTDILKVVSKTDETF